jgi:hypothetical protein
VTRGLRSEMGRRLLLVVPAPLLVAGILTFGPTTSSAAPAVSHAAIVPDTSKWTGPSSRHQSRVPAGAHFSSCLPAFWTSKNWSGYAFCGTGFHTVVGSWTVPTVLAPTTRSQFRRNQYSGTWVGIDGVTSRDLIQAGTEEDWLHGSTFYRAWWEILPAPETPIASVAVRPGDSITVTIAQGVPLWSITLTNNTTGQSFTTNQAYSGPGTSAEWVHEAVFVGRHISKLPRFTTFAFDRNSLNGASPAFMSSEAGAMIQRRAQVSTPSAPDSDNDGFSVAYGRAIPGAPGS